MHKKLRRSLIVCGVAAVTAVSALTGCSAGGASSNPDGYVNAETNKDLERSWSESLDALTKKFGDEVRITDVMASENDYSLQISIIDPKKPKELNGWKIAGTSIEQNATFDYGGKVEDLNASAFPVTNVDPAGVSKALSSAVKDSGKDGLKVASLSIGYPMVGHEGDPIQITVNLSSDRDSESLIYSINGKLKK